MTQQQPQTQAPTSTTTTTGDQQPQTQQPQQQNPFGMNPQMMQQMMQSMMGGGSGGSFGAQDPFAMFGGFGGANNFGTAQPTPTNTNQDWAQVYANQNQQLRDMGFFDDAQNIQALRRANGNVNMAVEYLLSNPN